MRSILALAGATAVSAMSLSAAQAQDCVNGYRTIGNDIVMPCETAPLGMNEPVFQDGAIGPDYREEQVAVFPEDGVIEEPAVLIEEPLVTGSLAGPGGLPADYREGAPIEAPIDGPIVTGSLAAPGGLPLDYREHSTVQEMAAEPVVTGAIVAPGGAPLSPDYREDTTFGAETIVSVEAEGSWTCQPGQYWIVGGEGRSTPVFCR